MPREPKFLRDLRWQDVLLGVALLGAVLIAYSPSISGGILWDDDEHITKPAMASLHGLWRTWFELGATQQYYPLLFTAFWVEHHAWGDALAGYHLVNIGLHAISACLVVAIMRRLALPGAWLGGFIFALHPVCAESIAWISEQKNTLSAVFYLGAALVYLRFDTTRTWRLYFIALGLFVLALLSKTVTATLPGVLLVIFWWQRGRLGWKSDVLPLVPWFFIGGGAGMFTAWVERKFIGAEGAAFELRPLERLLLMGRIPWFYFGKLLWPANLLFIYPRWTVNTAVWWQYLYPLAALVLLVGLCLLSTKNRAPLAACLIFLGTLLPVSGLFHVYPFLFSYVADHFQYLASLAIIVPTASVIAAGGAKIFRHRPALAAIAPGAILCVLWSLTFLQSRAYQDSEALYRGVLARNPACWMAAYNLARVLEAHGRSAEAISEYQAALHGRPDFAMAHNNLGEVLAKSPDGSVAAMQEFREALRIDPQLALAHYNLGVALQDTPGGFRDALHEYEATLRIDPDFADAHYNLGTIFQRSPGRLPDALAHFEAAVRLRPDFVSAEIDLGVTLAQTPGRLPEAIARFEEVLKAHPDQAQAQQDLALAKQLQRQTSAK